MAVNKVDFDVLAHDKASDKLDRISRAFRKLSQESDNVKKNDGLASLSKQLKKVSDDFEREGDRSGKRFGSGFSKWLTGRGAKLGEEGGTVFGSGFLGALKTPILGPALIATLGGSVAVAAPAVGAIAAGGVVAGFGAGLVGLGSVFAAKSEVVQSIWKKTLTDMGAGMQALSKPFENTLIAMSLVARRTFASFAPILGEAFKRMAPVVAAFSDQLGRGLERLKPAILPLTDAFNAVITTLGPAVQSAIGKVSDGLIRLAASVQRSPGALADLVRGMGDLVATTLDLITMLNDVNAKFKDLTGVSAVTAVMSGVNGVLNGTKMALQGLTAPIGLLDSGLQKVGLKSKSAGETQASFSSSVLATAASINKAIPPTETLAQKFQRQKSATDALITSLFRLQQGLLTLSGAQIGYQAAVDAATESIKENGKTHDINTAKGRANKSALDDVARSANEQTEAMIRNRKGLVAAATSAEGSRRNFIKLATQMGYTVPQAKRMAAQMIAIPNVSRTAKLTANKRDLEAKLAAAKRELANRNLTKERRARLTANIAALQAGIRKAKAALASVPSSKTVTIRSRYITERIVRTQTTAVTGGHAPAEPRALGGPVRKGQPYWVGEEGPEPFIPDQNGYIISNRAIKKSGTSAVMGASAPAGDIHIHLHGTEQQLMDQLARKLDDLRRQGRLRLA